jgi:tetratricopeptide (TPR) repeat protein
MRKSSSLTLVALILFFGACKPKDVEVSSVARAQAAHLASEAQMQNKLRDYAEAEESLARAVELDPEVAAYWFSLGLNRVMQKDMSGAKKAYKRELEIYEKAAKKTPKKDAPENIEARLNQIRPLLLLGRTSDANKLLAKVASDNPDNTMVRQLVDTKIIDQMLADAKIQEAMIK